jgi:hypothetical protein
MLQDNTLSRVVRYDKFSPPIGSYGSMLSKKSPSCRWVPWIALLGETWSRFRLWRSLDPSLDSHAAGANWGVTGGPMERSAKVLRFCTIVNMARRRVRKPRWSRAETSATNGQSRKSAVAYRPLRRLSLLSRTPRRLLSVSIRAADLSKRGTGLCAVYVLPLPYCSLHSAHLS